MIIISILYSGTQTLTNCSASGTNGLLNLIVILNFDANWMDVGNLASSVLRNVAFQVVVGGL